WGRLARPTLGQPPRDRRPFLLSLVLLGAQSLFVPDTPRPLVLALTLHLFLAFPTPMPFLDRPRHLWTIYLPAAVAGFLAALDPAHQRLLSDLLCLAYPGMGV